MRIRILHIIIIVVGFSCKGVAQDIHTSQIAEHDYIYNPGMIGNYAGNSRVQISSRNQWANINNAYQTYNAFFDFKIANENWTKGNLGICLAANNDNSGDGFLEKTSYNLGLSSVVRITENFSLSLGILNTYSQVKVDPNSIQWGTQFNGENHDPYLPSGEQFTTNSQGYFNMASGIVLSYGKDESYISRYDVTHIQLGFSGFNFLSPKNYTNLFSDSLLQRYCIFAKGLVGVPHTRTAFAGTFLSQKQGPNSEIVLGGYYRIRFKDPSKVTGYHKESAIGFGGIWRVGDAICPAILFEIKDYALGISYDMTMSKLLPATNSMGAIEVTLRVQTNNKFLYKGYKPR